MKKSTFHLLLITGLLFCFSQKSYSQCTVNAGSDPTIYVGYTPMACAVLNATSTGTAPFSYLWSNGSTTASITVCDQATTVYWVTVTDSSGCTATDSVTVNVVDARCGKGNKKILICHIPPGSPANAHSICVSANAVPAHLAHGDHIGDCNATPPPSCIVNLGSDTSICSGNTLVLNAGTGFTSYMWSDSSTGQTLSVTQSGTYWVHATDSVGNCSFTDSITIVVHDAPVVSAIADSLADSLGCRNITGTITGGTPPFTYTWSNGDSLSIIHVCDTVTTTYTLTVLDSNGCSGSASVTVVIGNAPCTINLGNDTSLCSGNTLLLDAGAGFLNYLWSDSSSAQTLSVTQSGTYWVQVSDTSTGCFASDTINVVIFNGPVVTAIADSLADSLGCRNIIVLISGGSPPFTYSWNTGDTIPVIHVCDSATTTYTVTVLDSNGCSGIDSVTINQNIVCSVSLGNDTSMCSGDTLLLDAGTGFLSYLWSDSSSSQTLSVTQSGTYWVQVSDTSTGCFATDTINVVIFNGPAVTAIADSLADSLGCRNIIVLISGGTPPFTYSWSTGDTIPVAHVCDSGSTTYTVTVLDSNGCSGSSSVTIVQIIPCTVNLGSDTSFCSGDSLLLDAGAGFLKYLWSDSSNAQTLYVSISGSYWVQVSDTGSACITSDTISVVIFNSPVASAVADTIPDSLGCVNITGSFTGGTPPFGISWSNGDTTLVIHVCDTLTASYTFTVVDSNGCSSSATETVNDTGQRPLPIGGRGHLEIYPNPVLDNARIGFNIPKSGTVKVEVFDLTGARISLLYQGFAEKDLTYDVSFSGSYLIEGIYLVRLTKPDGSILNRKLILFKY